MTKSIWLRLVATGFLILALAVPAVAAEEIRSFVSNITLAVNGTVDVTETLQVNAEGDQIRHGIFRDIPTQLINDDKTRLRSDLKVLSVARDGIVEPYSLESLGNGYKRIRIGSADVFLPQGVHTYVIHYTMTRMGRSFADHDELYWNATGNYWEFPILSAAAIVKLPPGAIISNTVGYTGRPGATEQAVTVNRTADDTVTVRSTRAFAAGEGLTVAVAFQPGILAAPQGLTAVGYWLSDHRELVFPSIAVLIVLLYNFLAWTQVGRDPQKGPIIPLFHPPKQLSPAQAHYINRMGFQQAGWKAFTASIFDLGVKGLVQIDKVGGTTSIMAREDRDSAQDLPPEESGIYSFIRSRGKVAIDKVDGPLLNSKRGEMVTAVRTQDGETYFKNNVRYTLAGAVLAAALLGVLVWLDVLEPVYLVVAVVIAIVASVFLGLLSGGGGSIVGRLFGFVWVAIVAVNIFGSSLSLASGFSLNTGMIAAASIIIIEIVFAFLMRAPTVTGRALMDQIESFKMYLNTAEKNRLNYVAQGEPPMTIPRFESILPFAIALGVERLWSQRFESDLARNAVAGAQGGTYSPLWYTGGDWSSSSGGFSSSVSSLASGMSAAMVASQASSSSGSGFSGGGGSGGGGGGGGGGGW
ncbi:MAG: DUF2207 domain-containing protein [Devosia sp.]